MKRILFIHHAVGWGGAPINMINIINSLNKEKYQIKVLLIIDSIVSDKLQQNNIEYVIANSVFYKKYYQYYGHTATGYIKWFQFYIQLKKTILWFLSRYFFATKELNKHRCDLIHLNSSVLTDWLAPSSRKCKVIYHVQEPLTKGTFGFRFAFFNSLVKKYADSIIAISFDNYQRIGIPDKTTVIYNFTEIPEELPSETSYSSKRVLYLGGAQYIKGFYTLVEALDYLDNRIFVYFGGDYTETNMSKNIKNLIKKLVKCLFSTGKKQKKAIKKIQNHPNVVLIGLTDYVDNYLNEVCCLVSPFSAPHFSRPVIESYLNRKPVIVSDVDGMEEIVKNGKTGIIVPKDNPKLLAVAINNLVLNTNLAMKMGEAGFAFAKQRFTYKNIILLESIYAELLD